MNIKLLGALNVITFTLLSRCPCAPAEEQMHSCPDMSEHERVLNEGIHVHKQHASPSLHSLPLDTAPNLISGVSDYTPSQREYDLYNALRGLVRNIGSLPLNTLTRRQTAEGYAAQFEELGMYAPAQKLYSRILAAKSADQESTQYELNKSTNDLQRVTLCQFAQEQLSKGDYLCAIETLDKAIKNLSTSDLNLSEKANLLKRVAGDIRHAVESQGSRPGLPTAEVIQSQKVKKCADALLGTWKRELECLGMAQQLDHTAWNLERDGQYPMAEKLYRQALFIKRKNLGPDNPETLAQSADLARLSAVRGHRAEACKFYEEALQALRKLPNPGRTYASMLESYGDMLDGMNEKTRADKIYEEARLYYEKTGVKKD